MSQIIERFENAEQEKCNLDIAIEGLEAETVIDTYKTFIRTISNTRVGEIIEEKDQT